MSIQSFISFRLLIKGKKFTGRILISVSGIALGVAVLYLTLGIMDGYRRQLLKVLKTTFAPIQVVTAEKSFSSPPEISDLADISKAFYTRALLLPCGGNSGRFVSVKGTDRHAGLILGEGVASGIGAREQDCVRLMFHENSGRLTTSTYRVHTVRRYGMPALDDEWCFLPLTSLPENTGRITFEIYPHPGTDDGKITTLLSGILPEGSSIITLREANEDLFATLAFQEWVMAVVLGLITGVAGVFFLSRLLMDMEERRKTVGVLRALGLTHGDVVKTFFFYGVCVGFLGILLGTVGGYLLSALINASPLLQFKGALSQVYGVRSIPIEIQPGHLLGVIAFAFSVVIAASLIPALRTRRIPVIEAIRYE